MAAQVTSTEFTNESKLFASRAEANAWRLSMQVPSATTSAEGAVKKAALPANSGATVTAVGINLVDENGNPVLAPTMSDYNTLKTLCEELQTKLNALLAAMVSSGQGVQ